MAHIPSGTTAQLELVTFQQALEAANTPSETFTNGSTHLIFTRNTGTYWEPGGKIL